MISHHASSNSQELKPADNLLWPHTKGLGDLMPDSHLDPGRTHAAKTNASALGILQSAKKRHQTDGQVDPAIIRDP